MTAPREGIGGRLSRLEPTTQWGLLVASSIALAALFNELGVPAAFLVGPLVSGILIATNGGGIRVPAKPYLCAQGVVGSFIAHAVTADIAVTFIDHWPVFLATVVAILAAASGLGWVMTRMRILPGTTAVWGTSPGAATPMMLMAEAFGDDARLVAFMQYLRVVIVALTAAAMSSFWLHSTSAADHGIAWLRPVDWISFAETVAITAAGVYLGRRFRIPGGGLLLPFFFGIVLQVSGMMRIELPDPLLIISYCLLGWSVGLSFNRSVVLHAVRVMPQIAASTVALVAFCGILAYVLTLTLGLDPLTAYLATSPGGIDAVGIIAAYAPVDVSFVVALQTFRMIMVLICGPSLARLVARTTKAPR